MSLACTGHSPGLTHGGRTCCTTGIVRYASPRRSAVRLVGHEHQQRAGVVDDVGGCHRGADEFADQVARPHEGVPVVGTPRQHVVDPDEVFEAQGWFSHVATLRRRTVDTAAPHGPSLRGTGHHAPGPVRCTRGTSVVDAPGSDRRSYSRHARRSRHPVARDPRAPARGRLGARAARARSASARCASSRGGSRTTRRASTSSTRRGRSRTRSSSARTPREASGTSTTTRASTTASPPSPAGGGRLLKRHMEPGQYTMPGLEGGFYDWAGNVTRLGHRHRGQVGCDGLALEDRAHPGHQAVPGLSVVREGPRLQTEGRGRRALLEDGVGRHGEVLLGRGDGERRAGLHCRLTAGWAARSP